MSFVRGETQRAPSKAYTLLIAQEIARQDDPERIVGLKWIDHFMARYPEVATDSDALWKPRIWRYPGAIHVPRGRMEEV
jgi:hypothetical protein